MARRRRRGLVAAGGQVSGAERGGEKLGKGNWTAGGVDEELRTARLEEELAAAAAGQQGVTVPGDDRDRDQRRRRAAVRRGRRRGVQGRHQPAFGAQGEPERRVLHVAARHDLSVTGQPGGADAQP